MKCPRCRKSQKCGSHSGKVEPFTVPITIRFTRAQVRLLKTVPAPRCPLTVFMRNAILHSAGLGGSYS